MKKISYCTTCKDRLWQLKQTLPDNILLTNDEIEIVILDYHSDDGLEGYIKDNYIEYLKNGRLRYFKLITEISGFDMAYAKHIVHLLGEGRVLFNLDADNFIGDTVSELLSLLDRQLLIPKLVKNTHTARCGRIGITKADYLRINGYDIDLLGMQNDDGDLIHRSWLNSIRFKFSIDLSEPIPQSIEQKFKHIRKGDYTLPNTVRVSDVDGNIIKINTRENTVVNIKEAT